MDSDSLIQKLSKSKSALIFIIIILISSVIATNIIGNYFLLETGLDVNVQAIEVDGRPNKTIPYIILEPYNIESIFTSNISLKISYKAFIEINNIMDDYSTNVVEYNNKYYRLQYEFEPGSSTPNESFVFVLMIVSTIFGFIFLISAILLVTIIIIKIGKSLLK